MPQKKCLLQSKQKLRAKTKNGSNYLNKIIEVNKSYLHYSLGISYYIHHNSNQMIEKCNAWCHSLGTDMYSLKGYNIQIF